MATDKSTESQTYRRGILQYLFDRLAAWMFSLSPERCSYTSQGMRIPISVGLSRIELAADLYQPLFSDSTKKPLGTVLMRCPYGRGPLIGMGVRIYAARGYQVLIVSSRGTFDSGGEFDPFRTEVEDGKGVVEWMRKQPWYTGTFATIGGSYLGFVQWALLCDPPKDMVAAAIAVGPHDFSLSHWETGSLNYDIVNWANSVGRQDDSIFTWEALTRSRKLAAVVNSVPVAQSVRTHLGHRSLWLENSIGTPDLSAPYYAPMRLDQALEQANIPIFIVTGWYDLFLRQSMHQYYRLKERGCDVALTIGPWAHMQAAVGSKVNQQSFDWIEEHLGGFVEAKRTSVVQYFVTGVKEWRNAATFPPNTTLSTFYLQSGGKLLSESASRSSESSTFTYDPRNPTPTMGGNALFAGGSVDDSALAKRSDVLVFDSAPLDQDFEFCGTPTVEITHSTDIPFADFYVRVSEVNEKGKSCNITEAFRRLDPNRGKETKVQLDLNPCAHRFLKGKRIRVMVAGGNFPQYARNQGVENKNNRESEMRSVEHTVYHGVEKVSKVVFPVVSLEQS
jgi:putative CocE/NonD family hydrolase